MESALSFQNKGDLTGKSVSIQGAGNVAGFIADILIEKGVKKVLMTGKNIFSTSIIILRRRPALY